MKTTKCPDGIKYLKGYKYEQFSIRNPRIQGTKPHNNTFEVEDKFEILDNGVRFNVETVPKAEERFLKKETKSRHDLFESVSSNAAKFYTKDSEPDKALMVGKIRFKPFFGQTENLDKALKPGKIRLESVFDQPENLVHTGADGFFSCCLTAFAQHLPLTLSPDHIWTVISYAFAKHVELNAEELRENFVKHEGKQIIQVETLPSFQMSTNDNPDSGATTTEWKSQVFSQFSKQIKGYIGEKTHSILTAAFSTTDSSTRTASEIMLMASMQKYFEFSMTTKCGIPEVTLLGKEDDWVAVREKTEALGALMTSEFSEYWLQFLLPVLDKFVEASQGKVHHGFWQSMVKFRKTGRGSGAYCFISGWVQILFPYLCNNSVNEKLKAWNEVFFTGPKPEEIPAILSSVPVVWDYRGTNFDIHFHSGFAGFSQDLRGGLKPVVGWFVTHDPKKPPNIELKIVQEQIDYLWLGHENDYDLNTKEIGPDLPKFFKRIQELELKEEKLFKLVSKVQNREALEKKNKRVCNTADFIILEI